MEIWAEHSRQREPQRQRAGSRNELEAEAVKGGRVAGAERARGMWEGGQSSHRGGRVGSRTLSECVLGRWEGEDARELGSGQIGRSPSYPGKCAVVSNLL